MPTTLKVRQSEVIPTLFVAFLQQANEMIESRDPSTLIESDDLLQCYHTYGGLVDSTTQTFAFKFVDGDKCDSQGFSIFWHFLLTQSQIKAIAQNELTALPMWRCKNDCGRRATVPDWYCTECDFPP